MLLLDAMFSYRVLMHPDIATLFPNSLTVRQIPAIQQPIADSFIAQYAVRHHLIVVTCDRDFEHIQQFQEPNLKLVRLVRHNPITKDVIKMLSDSHNSIHTLASQNTGGRILLV